MPVRSMAEGAEEEGAFLRLPAGQDERYAELLAAGLLPCARDGAGAERGLPEPSAIKSGKGPVGRAPLNGSRGEVAALTEPPPAMPPGISASSLPRLAELRAGSDSLSEDDEDGDGRDGKLKGAGGSPAAKRSVAQMMKDKKKQTQLTLQW